MTPGALIPTARSSPMATSAPGARAGDLRRERLQHPQAGAAAANTGGTIIVNGGVYTTDAVNLAASSNKTLPAHPGKPWAPPVPRSLLARSTAPLAAPSPSAPTPSSSATATPAPPTPSPAPSLAAARGAAAPGKGPTHSPSTSPTPSPPLPRSAAVCFRWATLRPWAPRRSPSMPARSKSPTCRSLTRCN